MPGKSPRMTQRDRSKVELSVLHVEIALENHELLRKLAAAKQFSVGGYVDNWLKRKKERLIKEGFI